VRRHGEHRSGSYALTAAYTRQVPGSSLRACARRGLLNSDVVANGSAPGRAKLLMVQAPSSRRRVVRPISSSERDPSEVVGTVFRRSVAWVVVANVAGFLVVSVYVNVIADEPRASPDLTVLYWSTSIAYVTAATAIGLRAGWRAFAATREYLAAGRRPTDRELQATLRLPSYCAGLVLVFWAVGAALEGIGGAFTSDAGVSRSMVIGVALGGMVTALLALLLLDREFRPLYELVLSGESPPSPGRIGISTRFLLAWGLGSGVPLLILIGAAIGDPIEQNRLRLLTWYFGTLGLVVGATLVLMSARFVSKPVEELRHALKRVQEGSLDASVLVNDAGEIGLLQAGFNVMVDGLRERQLLQDLFGRQVGTEVARAALERGVELGGEVVDVSVLFVDLVGSTALARTTGPHDVVRLLNEFFAAVIDSAHAESGWVNKFEGDAALCVFGAPTPVPDHRGHALRCARAMRRAIDALALSYAGLDAGIGISSGDVVAGHLGAADRYEYTVVGDPVNEAARLTELAKQLDGRVAASASTVDHAEADRDAWRPDRSIVLRGRDVATRVFVIGGQ
jgi:adenylate cyclase